MFEKCPNCGDYVSESIEGNVAVYSCQSCDWVDVQRELFMVGIWSVTIHQALAPIDILQSLLTSPDVAQFLRPRLKGISYLCDTGPIRQFTVDSDTYLIGEVDIAYQVYLRQMVVLASTYIELILKDFFRAFFVAKPSRMNTVLALSGKGEASIPLNEILKAESLDQLVLNLAMRASMIKGSGEPDKIMEALIKDCKITLDRPLVDDIRLLKERRNRIVHEWNDDIVDIQQVLNSFGMILYLLYVLVLIADIYSVPYLDDVDFMRDFKNECHNGLANNKS